MHESSSDPIMTEAALLLSPTANLRLHAFYPPLPQPTLHTHTNSHKETHTGCLCYLCEDIEKCQGNSLSSGVHKNTLTRLQFTDTLTVNTIRTHNTLYCFTFDTKVFPITCNLFLSALNLTILSVP